ncbi:unnamed protein product, partial [Heterosigma akashiwo]
MHHHLLGIACCLLLAGLRPLPTTVASKGYESLSDLRLVEGPMGYLSFDDGTVNSAFGVEIPNQRPKPSFDPYSMNGG